MPRIGVAPPPFVPALYGLLSVASIIDEADAHWRSGIEFSPDACAPAKTYGDACPLPLDRVKEIEAGVAWSGADPFTVYSGVQCSPVGLSAEEFDRRATAALVNGEGRAVEAAFWTGALDNGETLAGRLAEDNPVDSNGVIYPEATVIGGASESLGNGLALLEEALGDCYPGRGVIHMDRYAASHLADDKFNITGSTLTTMLGTQVAAGTGYPGTGPGNDAPAAGTRYMYATGAVRVTRSAVELVGEFRESLDRSVNTVTRLAERTYVIGWDCCLFAVNVEDPS